VSLSKYIVIVKSFRDLPGRNHVSLIYSTSRLSIIRSIFNLYWIEIRKKTSYLRICMFSFQCIRNLTNTIHIFGITINLNFLCNNMMCIYWTTGRDLNAKTDLHQIGNKLHQASSFNRSTGDVHLLDHRERSSLQRLEIVKLVSSSC
jgi:hypothetical protein